MDNQSCQDRVKENYDGRMDDLRLLMSGLHNEDCPKCNGIGETEENKECEYCNGTGHLEEDIPDLGNIFEYGLSFDYVAPHTFKDQDEGYFRYQLSWGGSSDEFRIYANTGRGEYDFIPYKIEYWFMDWFDGAHILLIGDDKKFIENLFSSMFCYTCTARSAFDEAMKDYEYSEDDEDSEDEDDN